MRPVSSLRGRFPHSISTVSILNMVISQMRVEGGSLGPWPKAPPVQGSKARSRVCPRRRGSPTDAQAVDELLVAVLVGRLDIVEQAPPLADHLEQPAARMIVLAVRLEMFGEIGDAFGQDRDLDLW